MRRDGWATHPGMTFRTALVLSCLCATSALANTEGDWFASLYTGEGTELRADERVFALYAVFNATGYDVGPVTRKDPVPKITYHPVRQAVRARVIGGDPEVKKAADAFFDAHPQPLAHYLAWAAISPAAPFAAAPRSPEKEFLSLKGFEAILAKAWTGWKLSEVMSQVQADYRKALKSYLQAVDGPMAKAQKLLGVPANAPSNVLVLNLLDTHDAVRAVKGDGEVLLVVGPSDKPNVEGLLREYARLHVGAAVARKTAGFAGANALWKEGQLAGAPDESAAEYAASLIGTALALKAMDAKDAAYDAAAQRGYFGVKEIARLWDEGKPVEGWVVDALSRADARKPARK